MLNSPFVYERSKKYRYVLLKDLSISFQGMDMGRHLFADQNGRAWLEIDKDTWTIKSGYAWDGASMAPDFPRCLLGTLIHDVGYQFLKVPCFPLTRIEVDRLFDAVMVFKKFALSWIYSRAVMVFGGLHSKFGGKKPHASCLIHDKKEETMTAKQRFAELLKKEGIKYFTADEVFYRGASDERYKLNTDPPEALWGNIIPTLKVLDQVREKVGRLRLNSIYRSPAYNTAIGGAKNSFHTRFQATDVVPLDSSVKKLHSEVLKLRTAGKFKGGVGKYPGFVHVDTRGTNADF